MQRPPRPALLTVGAYVSALFGFVVILTFIFAPLNIGSYSINNTPVTGPEFLRQVGWLFGAVGVVCIAVSYGLFKERIWTRPLMLSYWTLLGAYLLGDAIGRNSSEDLIGALLFTCVTLGSASAYLYLRKSVTDYYRTIATSEAFSAHAVPRGV
ncbi:MAG TPA: hypothetical protein VFU06_17100 [Longimicrobiales bacterium]|nr:hypothetical protein [Longimicrobiales bacterium]